MRNIRTAITAALSGAVIFTGAAGANERGIEEVTVTAQKRAESVQDVPISISALSENFIKDVGAQSVNDLGIHVPGLETRVVQVTQPAYNIRGITTDDFGIGADPAVAVYVDGVYSGRSGASMTAFQDVARVEVLKGPQGTLFGKNAAAGAIHIISNEPSGEFGARVGVSLGNYNKRKVEATVNAPLSDNLFLRVNVLENQRDGYRENLATGDKLSDENNGGARAALLWQVSDATKATLRLEYTDVDQDAAVSYGLVNGGNPYDDVAIDAPIDETLTLWGGSLSVESDLGGMQITSITAAKTFESTNLRDDDGTAIPTVYFATENVEENQFVSQELRLVSDNEGPLRWTLGAMYSREHGKQDSNLAFATDLVDRVLLTDAQLSQALAAYNLQAGTDYTAATAPAGFGWDILLDLADGNVDNILNWGTPLGGGQSVLGGFFAESAGVDMISTSAAIYGDMTYAFTDKLELTFGLRYTRDEKDFELSILPNPIFNINVALQDTVSNANSNADGGVDQDDSWSNLSTRLVLDYAVTDDAMLYASYATGYKAGGFNSTQLANSFDEENVTNYELGVKSTWLDRQLRFNGALFYYEYTDLQDLVSVENSVTHINELKVRNEDVEGQGIELEVQWLATEQFVLSANYTYLDSEITEFSLFENETEADDRTGEPQSAAAEQKFNLSAAYTLELDNAGDLNFRLGYSYIGDRESFGLGGATPQAQAMIDSLKGDLDGAYKNIDARITYHSSADQWQVSLYGLNLTDEEYLYDLGGIAGGVGLPVAYRGQPRLFGLEATYNF